ncbi:acetate/propionate family kinase [Niabella sp.]|uniref:acetate/propionate family kinase n=1 Tax=Niabella sp. TaxID=1962976 RepID=UPI00261CFC16|nr:acetate/propionate family kinase [Niabella sp.]
MITGCHLLHFMNCENAWRAFCPFNYMSASITGNLPEEHGLLISVNPGSSSIKFAVFSADDDLHLLLKGSITGIGSGTAMLKLNDRVHQRTTEKTMPFDTFEKLTVYTARILAVCCRQRPIRAIGHRVVHGGSHSSITEIIDDFFLKKLESIKALAPLHLPEALTTIAAFQRIFPAVLQVACFDTGFHRHMPFEARHYALPRYLWKEGLVRYGFHGLSCISALQYLQDIGIDPGKYRIIIAHLGSGSSITAVLHGKSIDTTMGFTPAGGLMMNTRCGDIDPGLAVYLLTQKKLTSKGLDLLFNKNSGLQAVSQSKHSLSGLLERESSDALAAQAIRMYCYQVKKQIGAMAAVLGGADILVFTGGIGENLPVIRERVCEGLTFLGIQTDPLQPHVPGASGTAVKGVYVIPSDEEGVIARQTAGCLARQHRFKNS